MSPGNRPSGNPVRPSSMTITPIRARAAPRITNIFPISVIFRVYTRGLLDSFLHQPPQGYRAMTTRRETGSSFRNLEPVTPGPPLSILARRPSMPGETPVPQTTHRNRDPALSAPDGGQITTADSEDSSPGRLGTPAPRPWHLRSSATLRPAIPARDRTSPEARRTSGYP